MELWLGVESFSPSNMEGYLDHIKWIVLGGVKYKSAIINIDSRTKFINK